ncbi:MAG: ATP-binding protein [Candidatus Dojkabacteria bacterium]
MKYLELVRNVYARSRAGKFRRKYVDHLCEQNSDKNISAVMGVRRAGKSTIMKQVLKELLKQGVEEKNTLYVNFEDPRLGQLLEDNTLFHVIDEFNKAADNRSRTYFLFDEIQNVQNWEQILRALLDQERNAKFYITGSSASLLGRELGTKLSGRYISTEVFPLSFLEIKQFSQKIIVKRFIEYGGFPDVVLSKNSETKQQLLRDYFESILLRDVAQRYNIRRDYTLRRLASWLFTNISCQASSYRLSKDLGISPDTVLQYFNYIEDAYLGFFIPKYSASVRKQAYNPKKFYSIDTGLQRAVSFRIIDEYGKAFENIVFLELRRRFKEIYYWEEEHEVDFIIKQGESIKMIINVCVDTRNEKTLHRECTSLQEAMNNLHIPESYLVVMKGENEVIETEVGKVRVVKFEDFVERVLH